MRTMTKKQSAPEESVPEETAPEESVPEETENGKVPEETETETEKVPEEIVPEETVNGKSKKTRLKRPVPDAFTDLELSLITGISVRRIRSGQLNLEESRRIQHLQA